MLEPPAGLPPRALDSKPRHEVTQWVLAANQSGKEARTTRIARTNRGVSVAWSPGAPESPE